MNATLVRARYVLTAAEPAVITDGAVRILGDRIDAVGTWKDLRARFPEDGVAGGPNDVVTPGFVNTHGHFSEALITGIAKRYTLWEWIDALIGPVAPHLDDEAAYVGTLIGGMQMLRSGITVANDMFVCDPRQDRPVTPGVVRALDDLGLRGVVSFGAGDVRGTSIPVILEEHAALAEAAAASRLSRFRVGIAALGAQSEALFAGSVELAVSGGHDGVHIHLQEVREEVTAIRARYGVTPIGRCARLGLFAAPTVAAHCVWVDADDHELLAEHGVGVAHNPVSNMILASGVCPVPELRALGIAVGIGVDGPASNDRQDMLEAIKTTVLLQRVDRLQATAFSAGEAFAMATIDGARSLGLDHELGSLIPGKAADLVVFDGEAAALANIHDPFGAIVYCAGPTEVKEVWVAGTRSVEGGRIVHVDPVEVVERSRPIARRILRAAGLG
ncbi:MAG: amidohydrolase family protein [Gammaproteobacteria bacterium]|nr:amidohydrolase family protein [Gammaproteobacteria bacterium]